MSTSGQAAQSAQSVAALMRARVADGRLPGGVVAGGVGGEAGDNVLAVGVQDLASGTPVAPDTLFFWDSLGKPVIAAVVLTFVAEGLLALDTPVTRWLPELAGPRVLVEATGDLNETVASDREATVEDLLTLRGGLGYIPDFEADYSVRLFADLQEGHHGEVSREQYLAAAAAMPLAHQPGQGWTYNTGATLLGLLVERVGGASLDELTATRVLTPLGMDDTTWWVDAARRPRFASRYVDSADGVRLVDAADGVHAAPPSFPDGAGALIGPVGDWVRFARMLAGGGELDGVRVLPKELVSAMMTDHLDNAQRAMGGFFLTDVEGQGWGYGGSVRPDGSYGWAGSAGTWGRVDPATGELLVVFTQLALHGPQGSALFDEVDQVWGAR